MLPFALGVLLSTDFVLILKTDKVAYQSLGYIAILAILGTALALVVFNFLIKRTSAVYASSVTFLMPIVVLFWSVLIGEKITWVHVLALLLILIGVYVLNFVKK